jgi:hypothetical protein
MLDQRLFWDDGQPIIRADHWSLFTVHGTPFPVHGPLFAVFAEPTYSLPTMLPGKPMSVMRLPPKGGKDAGIRNVNLSEAEEGRAGDP